MILKSLMGTDERMARYELEKQAETAWEALPEDEQDRVLAAQRKVGAILAMDDGIYAIDSDGSYKDYHGGWSIGELIEEFVGQDNYWDQPGGKVSYHESFSKESHPEVRLAIRIAQIELAQGMAPGEIDLAYAAGDNMLIELGQVRKEKEELGLAGKFNAAERNALRDESMQARISGRFPALTHQRIEAALRLGT